MANNNAEDGGKNGVTHEHVDADIDPGYIRVHETEAKHAHHTIWVAAALHVHNRVENVCREHPVATVGGINAEESHGNDQHPDEIG